MNQQQQLMALMKTTPKAVARPVSATPESNRKTFDGYLAGVTTEQRAILEKLRKAIRAVAPNAEECISYGLAAFRLNGRPLVASVLGQPLCVLSDELHHRKSHPCGHVPRHH